MPLRNRVDPMTQIHAVPQRGAWFGNRGVLHDKQGLRRLYQGKRWIICELEFKGRKRKLLQPGRYTELFFMDEATALSAGHRPCKECRRESANHFLELAGFETLAELDDQLHEERLGAEKPLVGDWRELPTGTFIAWLARPYLIKDERLWHWSFDGYRPVTSIEEDIAQQVIPHQPYFADCDLSRVKEELTVRTPATTIEVLRHGYPPQIAPV